MDSINICRITGEKINTEVSVKLVTPKDIKCILIGISTPLPMSFFLFRSFFSFRYIKNLSLFLFFRFFFSFGYIKNLSLFLFFRSSFLFGIRRVFLTYNQGRMQSYLSSSDNLFLLPHKMRIKDVLFS